MEKKRSAFLLAGLAAGITDFVLFFLIDLTLYPNYRQLIKKGQFFQDSILGGEKVYWISMVGIVIVIGFLISWLYDKLGDKSKFDWKAALKIGGTVFVIGTLISVYNLACYFVYIPRHLPVVWGMEVLAGVTGSSMVCAFIYHKFEQKKNRMTAQSPVSETIAAD